MEDKPKGVRTSEFWVTVFVIVIGLLPTSGLMAPDSVTAKLVGLISMTLAAMGYTYSRGLAKSGQ